MIETRRDRALTTLGYNQNADLVEVEKAQQKEARRWQRKQEKRERLLSSPLLSTCYNIAKLMDRYYLDPVVGFIPGGDILTQFLNVPFVWMSLVKIRSLPLTLAVIFNSLLDMLLGAIPAFIGDIIDIFFKSYKKNLQLIIGYIEDDKETISTVRRYSILMGIGIFLLCYLIYLVFSFISSTISSVWHFFT